MDGDFVDDALNAFGGLLSNPVGNGRAHFGFGRLRVI